eukprot:6193998-Pleurochrysis_carterae.AAC.4
MVSRNSVAAGMPSAFTSSSSCDQTRRKHGSGRVGKGRGQATRPAGHHPRPDESAELYERTHKLLENESARLPPCVPRPIVSKSPSTKSAKLRAHVCAHAKESCTIAWRYASDRAGAAMRINIAQAGERANRVSAVDQRTAVEQRAKAADKHVVRKKLRFIHPSHLCCKKHDIPDPFASENHALLPAALQLRAPLRVHACVQACATMRTPRFCRARMP